MFLFSNLFFYRFLNFRCCRPDGNHRRPCRRHPDVLPDRRIFAVFRIRIFASHPRSVWRRRWSCPPSSGMSLRTRPRGSSRSARTWRTRARSKPLSHDLENENKNEKFGLKKNMIKDKNWWLLNSFYLTFIKIIDCNLHFGQALNVY